MKNFKAGFLMALGWFVGMEVIRQLQKNKESREFHYHDYYKK